jgi:serine/threonine protein kinase
VIEDLNKVHAKGIIHRDIKTDNIIIRNDGSAVLIDFGAARQAIIAKSKPITTILTPGFAPIEQYSTKANKIGPWTDIYSLAAVVIYCLKGGDVSDVLEDASDRVEEDNSQALINNLNVSSQFKSALIQAYAVYSKNRVRSLKDFFDLLNYDENKQLKELDSLLNMAGIDKIIDINEFDMILNKADQLSIPMENAVTYIKTYAAGKNWQVTSANKQSPTIENDNVFQNQQIKPTLVESNNQQVVPMKNQKCIVERDITLEIQKLLKTLDYNVATNGELDSRTIAAIKIFEKDQLVTITGVADTLLQGMLNKALDQKIAAKWQTISDKEDLMLLGQFYVKYRHFSQLQIKKADERAWLLANNMSLKEESPEAFRKYAKYFDDGKYIKQVSANIVGFSKSTISRRDDISWQRAMTLDNYNSYKEYINKYPKGKMLEQAFSLLESKAWISALNKDEKTKYESFLHEFPNSLHVEDAKAFITESISLPITAEQIVIKDKVAWEKAKRLDTPISYQAYLKDFPNGKMKDNARSLMRKEVDSKGDKDSFSWLGALIIGAIVFFLLISK